MVHFNPLKKTSIQSFGYDLPTTIEEIYLQEDFLVILK